MEPLAEQVLQAESCWSVGCTEWAQRLHVQWCAIKTCQKKYVSFDHQVPTLMHWFNIKGFPSMQITGITECFIGTQLNDKSSKRIKIIWTVPMIICKIHLQKKRHLEQRKSFTCAPVLGGLPSSNETLFLCLCFFIIINKLQNCLLHL